MSKFAKSFSFVAVALLVLLAGISMVNAAGLVANITSPVTGTTVNIGQTVNLSANSTSAVGEVNYIWSFNDGTATRSGQNQTVAFTTAGVKTITLMAGDTSGINANVKTVNITVAGNSTKPVISNIQAINITTTGVTITWTTNIPATSRVIYDNTSHLDISGAEAPNFGYVTSSPETDTETKVTAHSVTISGLSPATKYYFRVISQS
jgi:PKD repeat protein